MGNKNPDEKDIKSYIREGWHFRSKTVKGRKYITRRKGQMERGIGPYNPELWDLITQLVSQVDTDEKHLIKTRPLSNKNSNERKVFTQSIVTDEYDTKWRKLLEQISMYRGIQMMMSCTHRDSEGYCSYWNWEKKPNFFQLLETLMGDESYKKKEILKNGNMVERWLMKSFHWSCTNCSAYQVILQ